MNRIKVNGYFLDLLSGSKILPTFRAISFVNFEKPVTAFSNAFRVAKTARNMQALGFPDAPNVAIVSAFAKIPCELYASDVFLIKGYLQVLSDDADATTCVFVGAGSDWFATAKATKLNEFDVLSYFAHELNITNYDAYPTVYSYPVIDFGKLRNAGLLSITPPIARVDINELAPATYVKGLLNLFFTETGYTARGSFWDSSELAEMAILPNKPVTFNKVNAKDGESVGSTFDDANTYTEHALPSNYQSFSFLSPIQRNFSTKDELEILDAMPSASWGDFDGNSRKIFVRIELRVVPTLFGRIVQGASGAFIFSYDIKLHLLNGASTVKTYGGTYANGGRAFFLTDTVDFFNDTAPLVFVDVVTIPANALLGFSVELLPTSYTTDGVSFVDDLPVQVYKARLSCAVREISVWQSRSWVDLRDYLPSISFADLVKWLTTLGIVVSTDEESKTITFDYFDNVADNVKDLSEYLEFWQDIDYVDFLRNYGKVNYFDYAESRDDEIAVQYERATGVPYGRGQIRVNNDFLPETKAYYKAPFAPNFLVEIFNLLPSHKAYAPYIPYYNAEIFTFTATVNVGQTFISLADNVEAYRKCTLLVQIRSRCLPDNCYIRLIAPNYLYPTDLGILLSEPVQVAGTFEFSSITYKEKSQNLPYSVGRVVNRSALPSSDINTMYLQVSDFRNQDNIFISPVTSDFYFAWFEKPKTICSNRLGNLSYGRTGLSDDLPILERNYTLIKQTLNQPFIVKGKMRITPVLLRNINFSKCYYFKQLNGYYLIEIKEYDNDKYLQDVILTKVM